MGIDIGGFIGSIAGGALTGGLGPSIGKAIEAAVPSAGKVAEVLVDRLVPDPTKQAELQAVIEQAIAERDKNLISAMQQQDSQQAAINLAEAQGNDRFSSRWRPALAWIGVLALAYQFLIAPFVTWVLAILGVYFDVTIPVPIMASTDQLWPLLTGLLGIGSMRTIERTQGIPGALPPQLPAPQTGRR